MSAAEKLKALMEARDGYFDVGHSSDYALVAALPQIVAVVEAAETATTVEGPDSSLLEALSALDEALGDVT